MCIASIKAKVTRDAKLGDTARLIKDDSGQPFFHTEGDAPDVVTCITDGSHVVVLGLTMQAAREFGTECEFEAIFAQDPNDEADAVWLGEDRFISLYELLQNGGVVTVYYSGQISEKQISAYTEACQHYFYGRRMAVATAWGSGLLPVQEADGCVTNLDQSLSANTDRDQLTDSHEQAAHQLEDA